MNADDPLLKILVCPLDKGPLRLLPADEGVAEGAREGEALYNPRLRLRYPVLDGIPQLLPTCGERVGDDEHEELLRRAGS
ncbi:MULTISPECIES: Trm112 family protein [unclassified Streptomyces]|uniref:Trm112 family protein n=1 Tax=unclassified Streptomyces TaxID=2593676 RepID=UPI001908AAA4|nr:Trm112 family protein [Streptomyces sp. HSG2]